MIRIILEDIKLNKEKKHIIPQKEEIKVANNIPKINLQEEEKKDVFNSKIDEYFKSRNTNIKRIERTPQIKTKSIILHKPILVFLIICIIGGGIYWGGEFFQKADVVITSKNQLIKYQNNQFVASKDTSTYDVNFEIMITSDKKTRNIVLTEPKEVSIKSKGSITLYNEFSTKPEKLLAETFLADNEGKTYKTDSTVTIPGYKIDVNKKIIPGEITVDITSFLAGDIYNGSPTDFYINSFKKTAKYNKIYGKLKTPLTGGASGLVYTLDEGGINRVDSLAQTTIKSDLLQKVKALVPEGYILYPDAMTYSYSSGNNIMSKTAEAEIEIEGTLAVILLEEKSLMNNVIKVSLPEIKGDELKEISILDLDKLIFNFIDKEQIVTKELNSIHFSLTGDINAIWRPNIDILKTKLLGVEKDNVSAIFREDPGISSALVKIFPPWQSYLPKDLNKINIILK